MPRLYNLPRGYPRHFRGRRFNRLSGSYAPRTYGNFGMARRATHIRGGHQATPYGAGGGGRRQIHGTYSGPNAIFASARGAAMHGGHNLGLTAHTPGYRGTRVASGFRKDQASIKRYFNKEILAKRRELRRAPAANKNRLRHEIQQLGMILFQQQITSRQLENLRTFRHRMQTYSLQTILFLSVRNAPHAIHLN